MGIDSYCVKGYSMSINRLFAYCKGGNFTIHILARLVISSSKEGKSGFVYNLVKN